MIEQSVIFKRLAYLLICVCVLIGNGCRFPWQTDFGDPALPSPQLIKQYHQAVTAYQAQAYDDAGKRFAAVIEQVQGGQLARAALFGLACTRLMTAETPRQYHRAAALWESWVKQSSNNFDNENPVLMAPLVKEKMLFSNIPLTPDGRGDIEASPKVSQWLVINSAKEIDRLEAMIESSTEANRKLKENNTLLRKEITKLKRKIKALETIDQKMQKKKSAIPITESTTPR